jgi:hypothetical protein
LSVDSRRLDEAKVETLRAWGEGLHDDPREEVRAAGRAITMLVEEIERLNIDLWHARTDTRQEPLTAQPIEAAQLVEASPQAEPLQRALPPPLPAF